MMSLVLESQSLPLHVDVDGVIRVASPRVTLETVIAAFAKGATAEQIAQDYPVVPLADIYAVIAFYLRQPEAVDTYLAEQRHTGQHLRRQIEAHFDPHGIRDRLLARRTSKGQPDAPASGG
jgi:uncharacterized protein (DUF433 family)